MAGRLWIDVEDLFLFARRFPRPTGIQRVAFEIAQALQAAETPIGFLRHDTARQDVTEVPWHAVAAVFAAMAEAVPPRVEAAASGPPPAGRRLLRKLVHRLSPQPRALAIDALVAQEQALHHWASLGRALLRRGAGPAQDRPVAGQAAAIGAGDVMLDLGGAWSHPDYPGLLRRLRARHGLRFATLVHDIIPLRRPEWCDPGLADRFARFIDGVLPQCDRVFAVSRATAGDVTAYAREQGMVLAGPVRPIPLGSGFGSGPDTIAPRTARLPPPGSYALVVGTLEARKNHMLLFRIWRDMLEQMPADAVPTLVFAGRVGWLVADLMQQIANSRHLGGKLLVLENPSDSEVAALYQGCRFTLFPSAYEGWGLPVSESLAFGKPCLIADRSSLPEAGAGLARGFDPDNLADAAAAVRRVIDDPDDLAAWAAQIRREFRPVPWAATARAIVDGLAEEQ